jgi:hypothetical protein
LPFFIPEPLLVQAVHNKPKEKLAISAIDHFSCIIFVTQANLAEGIMTKVPLFLDPGGGEYEI